jgi:hypothetical protein
MAPSTGSSGAGNATDTSASAGYVSEGLHARSPPQGILSGWLANSA